MNYFRYLAICVSAAILVLSGCSTNPVTGKSELNFVSESAEINIGKKQYLPTRQSSGGDYVVDKRLTAYVASVGKKLARVSDRKLPYEFVVINDGTPNAWALPGGKIAVNRGLLLALKNEAELAAVLGHEIVHAAARHGAQSMERGILMQGAVLATGIALGDKDYGALAVNAAGVGAGLLAKKYSRGAELESDQYGILYMYRAGYDPRAAISLQKTFVRLSKEKKSNWLNGLFASHPPSQERVERNKAFVKTLDLKNLTLGKKVYQKAIKRLQKTKLAYDAYDKGVKAVKDKQSSKVMSFAKKAITIEPKEALFHSLKGDAYSMKNQYRSAEKAYSKAIRLNPSFYRFYLERGLARKSLGRTEGARQDFNKSNQFLATELAHYNLGLMAQQSGNTSVAISHFKKVSGGASSTALQAKQSLQKLQLSQHPEQYIKATLGASRSGEILIILRNKSSVSMRTIRMVMGVRGYRELLDKQRFNYNRVLKSGTQVVLRTGRSLNQLKKMVVIVESASVVHP